MTYPQAIALAIVQGITEFLPISSSGHLVILQKYFNFTQPPVLFDILVHVGTLGAIIFYLRNQLSGLLKGMIKKKEMEFKTTYLILVGTLPAGLVGFFLQGNISPIFDSLRLVGFSLLITAGFLFSTRFVKGQPRDFKILNWKDALFVGFFQSLAILPGISRSGSTIVAGLWRDLKKETAFLFSFYLAIPAILGALLLQIPDLIYSPCSYLGQGILGMLMASLIGYFSLRVLEKALQSAKFYWFGLYCLVVGLINLVV